jgi:hypothetical protein
MSRFKVRETLPDTHALARLRGKIGTSPLKRTGLMIPLSFDGEEHPVVFFIWEVEEKST